MLPLSLVTLPGQLGGAVCVYEKNSISLEGNVSLINNSATFGGAIYALFKNTITLQDNALLPSHDFVELANNTAQY